MPASEKRKLFYQFALDNIEILNKQFAQFGLLTYYSKFYCTLTKDYEKRQIQLFVEMIKKAALAEAEIEYKDLISPSIYVKFNVMMEKIFDK